MTDSVATASVGRKKISTRDDIIVSWHRNCRVFSRTGLSNLSVSDYGYSQNLRETQPRPKFDPNW